MFEPSNRVTPILPPDLHECVCLECQAQRPLKGIFRPVLSHSEGTVQKAWIQHQASTTGGSVPGAKPLLAS